MTHALHRLVAPVCSTGLPAGFTEASATFDQAVAAYEQGDDHAAATAFLRAASLLAGDEPGFAAGRTVSYRNAMLTLHRLINAPVRPSGQ